MYSLCAVFFVHVQGQMIAVGTLGVSQFGKLMRFRMLQNPNTCLHVCQNILSVKPRWNSHKNRNIIYQTDDSIYRDVD